MQQTQPFSGATPGSSEDVERPESIASRKEATWACLIGEALFFGGALVLCWAISTVSPDDSLEESSAPSTQDTLQQERQVEAISEAP